MKMTVMPGDKPKTPLAVYLVGILGLIPLLGVIVGVVLIILGIAAYGSWKLIVIGSAGILWSVVLYGSLFYFGFYSSVGRSVWASIAQKNLTDCAHALELYKLEYGDYPDSLQQLYKKNNFAFISDPTQIGRKSTYLRYAHYGDHYTLYSVGVDGIANTRDDIYPAIPPDTGRIHYGWIKP
jgi:type II secretory pathway pseudopilin PulG